MEDPAQQWGCLQPQSCSLYDRQNSKFYKEFSKTKWMDTSSIVDS